MFKDFRKYLSASIQVYLLLLVLIFIMKLVGLDYFGLDLDNKIVISISNFITKNMLINNLILFFPLIFNQYVIISYTCNDNSKSMLLYNVILIPAFCLLQGFKIDIFGSFAFVIEELYFLIVSYFYKNQFNLKRFFTITILMMVAQLISILTRYNYSIDYVNSPVANTILNLDYLLMLFIVYKLNFMKGGSESWVDGFQEVQFSSLQKKQNFTKLLERLQESSSSFNKLTKVDKAAFVIYFVLSLLWNLFTVVTVILIAYFNDTVVECIFILTSFWISKRVFGKVFHLKSMTQCFILSNLTYYVLNRITTPIGISILVPIMLGVGLSYITSKFVKNYKPLYKGMPVDEFNRTILEVVEKDSDKYNICYDFFINKTNAILLGMKYNYTEAGIRKITARVNDKIKALR